MYQGTTSVVPISHFFLLSRAGFSPRGICFPSFQQTLQPGGTPPKRKPPVRLSLPPGVAVHQRITGGNKKWARAHRCASPTARGPAATPGGVTTTLKNTAVLCLLYARSRQNSTHAGAKARGYPARRRLRKYSYHTCTFVILTARRLAVGLKLGRWEYRCP